MLELSETNLICPLNSHSCTFTIQFRLFFCGIHARITFFFCKLFFFISYSVNKLSEIASLRLNNVLLNFATYHVDELDGNKSLTLSGSFNFH